MGEAAVLALVLVTTDNVYLWGVRVVISPHGWGVILKNRSNLAPSDVSPESTVEIACFGSVYVPTKMTVGGVRGFPPKKILKNRSNLAQSDVSPESTVEIACLCSEYLRQK